MLAAHRNVLRLRIESSDKFGPDARVSKLNERTSTESSRTHLRGQT